MIWLVIYLLKIGKEFVENYNKISYPVFEAVEFEDIKINDGIHEIHVKGKKIVI